MTVRHRTDPDDLTGERPGVPDNPCPLPPGRLACRACGVACPEGGEVIEVDVLGREGVPAMVRAKEARLAFGCCQACAGLHRRAAELVAEHPAIARRIGDTSNAVHRVECALYGLAVLSGAEAATDATVELAAMLRHLTVPGAHARWVARFTPIMATEARRNSCSPYPWAHVGLAQRRALRLDYSTLLREQVARTAPPRRVPVPAPSVACLMCGVGAVLVSALDVARDVPVWREKGSGHLCPVCFSAVEYVGALGPTAMEQALVRHLTGGPSTRFGVVTLDGLQGWAALGTTRPNNTPWEHVTHLDKVRQALSR